MILNQTDFFARSATLNGAITGTDTQITLSGLSTRFTDAVTAGTVRYPVGPLRVSDDDGFELIAITGHVSGSTFEVERGIQGTTAEAWADGTAVRAVVTSRQLSSAFNGAGDITSFVDGFVAGGASNAIIGSTSVRAYNGGRVYGSAIFLPASMTISSFGVLYDGVGSDDGIVEVGIAPLTTTPLSQEDLIASGVASKIFDAYMHEETLNLQPGIYIICALHTGFTTAPEWFFNRRRRNSYFNVGRATSSFINSDTDNMQAVMASGATDLTDLSSFTLSSSIQTGHFVAILRT